MVVKHGRGNMYQLVGLDKAAIKKTTSSLCSLHFQGVCEKLYGDLANGYIPFFWNSLNSRKQFNESKCAEMCIVGFLHLSLLQPGHLSQYIYKVYDKKNSSASDEKHIVLSTKNGVCTVTRTHHSEWHIVWISYEFLKLWIELLRYFLNFWNLHETHLCGPKHYNVQIFPRTQSNHRPTRSLVSKQEFMLS